MVPGSSTTSSSSSSSGSPSPTPLPHESTGSAPIPASIECESADEQARGNPSSNPTKNPKPNNDVDHEQVRSDQSFSEIPEWPQEFRENLVDERVSEYRDSHASSSHEPSLELQQRTKITRAPYRRRIGEVVLRAKIFGGLIAADHKVLGEGCESRNNHQSAVVAPALATQWLRTYPCKTKTSQETERSSQKFFEPTKKTKVVYTDNSWELGKACEDLSYNHCTSTPHRSQTSGIAKRAVRRVKEGTFALLLQSGLDEIWWADAMACYCDLRNIKDRFYDRKTPFERRFEEPFKGPIIPFGSLVENHPISTKDQS